MHLPLFNLPDVLAKFQLKTWVLSTLKFGNKKRTGVREHTVCVSVGVYNGNKVYFASVNSPAIVIILQFAIIRSMVRNKSDVNKEKYSYRFGRHDRSLLIS